MGRRLRNKLPTAKGLLAPQTNNAAEIKGMLDKSKASQKLHYDKKRATTELLWCLEMKSECNLTQDVKGGLLQLFRDALHPGPIWWREAERSCVETASICAWAPRLQINLDISLNGEMWTKFADVSSDQAVQPQVSAGQGYCQAEGSETKSNDSGQPLVAVLYISKKCRRGKPHEGLNLCNFSVLCCFILPIMQIS